MRHICEIIVGSSSQVKGRSEKTDPSMLAHKTKPSIEGHTHLWFRDGTVVISTEFHGGDHLGLKTKGVAQQWIIGCS